MKVDTLGPLVDTQPAYAALAELKDGRGLYDRATRAFLRAKLKGAVRELREAAKHLEEQLEAL